MEIFGTMLSFLTVLSTCKAQEYQELKLASRAGRAIREIQSVKGLSKVIRQTLADYDSQLRPDYFGPAVQITISLHIGDLPYISEIDMTFQVDFYLRQTWTDDRLKLPGAIGPKHIPLGHEFEAKIWVPGTFFPNERHSEVHTATVPNKMFRWYPNGTIFSATHMLLTASCPMNLATFPMDQQVCSMEMQSWTLHDKEIRYDWDQEQAPVTFGPGARGHLQNFKLAAYRQRKVANEFTTGVYTSLLCDFLLERYISYYLLEMYIPTALIVLISFSPFWMRNQAAWERITIGVTTILTMTSLMRSIHSNSPKVSYITAIDVYTSVSFGSVFLSLLMSTLVLYLYHINGHKSSSSSSSRLVLPFVMEKGNMLTSGNIEIDRKGNDSERPKDVSALIDTTARWLFPASFLIFNVAYWIYYLNLHGIDLREDESWIGRIEMFHLDEN